MPEIETGKDPIGAFRGKSLWQRLADNSSSAWEHYQNANYIPPYQPTNVHWEITFSALGWQRETIEKFWVVFCRINTSLSGEISIMEFLNYFNLDRTLYIEKCFAYFDTTGGDDIDFLEFMVSVWNICTLKIDTLTNFSFDLYDLDSDGELSFPEIERMVQELYGKDGTLTSQGKECLKDVTLFAEERGGTLNLTAFTVYTMNHSMLLFPVFQIQRIIQAKVMGVRYWQEIDRRRPDNEGIKAENVFDPRHVQILLRSYKTGGAAAVLTHTGDANQGLREWFEKHYENKGISPTELGPRNDEERASRWKSVQKVLLEGKRMGNVVNRFRRHKDGNVSVMSSCIFP